MGGALRAGRALLLCIMALTPVDFRLVGRAVFFQPLTEYTQPASAVFGTGATLAVAFFFFGAGFFLAGIALFFFGAGFFLAGIALSRRHTLVKGLKTASRGVRVFGEVRKTPSRPA